MLTIYHWEPIANGGKPVQAAFEKGVEFESRYIDMLAFDQHKPEYLKLNPNGTIPAVIHDGKLITESTVSMEYIDATFPGPPLRPSNPVERWRMRWWCRFFDEFVGPSVSMIGWSFFVGPAMRQRDPDELKAAIERIPLKERRVAWSKAIYGKFSEEELSESRRRLAFSAGRIEAALQRNSWLAGSSFSLADIGGFQMLAGMPQMFAEAVSDGKTPYMMEWLRKIHERPSTAKTLALGRTNRMNRFAHLERKAANQTN